MWVARGREMAEHHTLPEMYPVEFAGATYHVMARVDRTQAIVRDEQIGTLLSARSARLTGGLDFVYAWVPMGNHYPQANLSRRIDLSHPQAPNQHPLQRGIPLGETPTGTRGDACAPRNKGDFRAPLVRR
jgi:hypothetical protein